MTLLYGGIVGIALGLTGGGGSIFAVRLLLYAVSLPLWDAITVSLAVVGLTALYGSVIQRRLVNWAPGAIFGVDGILGALGGAWLGVRLPEFWTLLLFASLMTFISVRMWRGANRETNPDSRFACRRDADGVRRLGWSCGLKLLTWGGLTGILSGTFGVGGGFLVVPALLLVTAMPIEHALATSLVCIFLISASGFASNLLAGQHLEVGITVWFLTGEAIGMTAGAALNRTCPGRCSNASLPWVSSPSPSGSSLRRYSMDLPFGVRSQPKFTRPRPRAAVADPRSIAQRGQDSLEILESDDVDSVRQRVIDLAGINDVKPLETEVLRRLDHGSGKLRSIRRLELESVKAIRSLENEVHLVRPLHRPREAFLVARVGETNDLLDAESLPRSPIAGVDLQLREIPREQERVQQAAIPQIDLGCLAQPLSDVQKIGS